MPNIYILLTKTNSILSRAISYCTKEEYVHTSIIMNSHLDYGYSFSRRNMKNPLVGGFVKEDYSEWITYFKNVQCCIYQLEITDHQYNDLEQLLTSFYSKKENYKYDFLGLIAQSMKINRIRENKFFCTQFVAYALSEVGALSFEKPAINIRSADFKSCDRLKLIYQGSLEVVLNEALHKLNQEELIS